MEEEITRSSEVVFEALCNIVGNEDLVKFYRLCSKLSVLNTPESYFDFDRNAIDILRTLTVNCPGWMSSYFHRFLESIPSNLTFPISATKVQLIDSGSRAEGFTFESSDHDVMFVPTLWKVVQNSIHENHTESVCIILFAERDHTRPGFVRLRATQHRPTFSFHLMFTKLNNDYYLSNSVITSSAKILINNNGLNSDHHGPCITSTCDVRGDIDIAGSLSSETWPHEAVGCVHRLFKRRWPSDDVIKTMVNDGCLFVPIGCKTSPHQDIEWRMSFSLAEKRLVHSMNHTQFLTYALLKLFLKEVIEENRDIKGLLCSYFMKTLVFWEIMETNIPWAPSCLLPIVWNCLRRLLVWINNEYCPNFFIPENNMFHGKIHGSSKKTLLCFLCSHYNDGYSILLQVPSIRSKISTLGAVTRERGRPALTRSKVIKWIIYYTGFKVDSLSKEVKKILETSQSNVILEFSQFLKISHLNKLYFKHLCVQFTKENANKVKYAEERILFRLIKASSPDSVRSKLFMAIYFYRCKQYNKCIQILCKVKAKLRNNETMYIWNFDSDRYSSLGGDQLPVLEGMRRLIASCVPLDSETCLPEISEECSRRSDDETLDYVPPLVMTRFLFFLCYFWTGKLRRASAHLKKLQHCCKYSTSHIMTDTHPLSWEILGIGQEIIGNFQQALVSYEECASCSWAIHKAIHRELLKVNKTRRARIKAFLNMV